MKVLDDATDKLAEAIRSGVDSDFPEICEVQQGLLELLIDLKPTFGLQ